MSPSRRGSKRGNNGRSPVSRARKKQKRLDAIVDKPHPLVPSSSPPFVDSSSDNDALNAASAAAADRASLRRSSRPRRAPDVLDSSPVPSSRMRKKPKPTDSVSPKFNVKVNQLSNKEEEEEEEKMKKKTKTKKRKKKKKKKEKSVSVSLSFEEEEEEEEDSEGWRARLRSRAKESKLADDDSGEGLKEGRAGRRKRDSQPVDEIEKQEEADDDGGGVGGGGDGGLDKISEDGEEEKGVSSESQELDTPEQAEEAEVETDNVKELETSEQAEEPKVASDLKEVETSEQAGEANVESDLKELETSEQAEGMNVASDLKETETAEQAEGMNVASDSKELETAEQAGEAREDNGDECTDAVQEKIVAGDEMDTKSDENATNGNGESEKTVKGNDVTLPISEEKLSSKRVKEGRRCGLCGGGADGKPPKKLARESVESDNEAYEGSSASEEPNYDIWDGFGDEPGWLGRLLGPIHDRFGIARVWVHQHCAVWSPEVS